MKKMLARLGLQEIPFKSLRNSHIVILINSRKRQVKLLFGNRNATTSVLSAESIYAHHGSRKMNSSQFLRPTEKGLGPQSGVPV